MRGRIEVLWRPPAGRCFLGLRRTRAPGSLAEGEGVAGLSGELHPDGFDLGVLPYGLQPVSCPAPTASVTNPVMGTATWASLLGSAFSRTETSGSRERSRTSIGRCWPLSRTSNVWMPRSSASVIAPSGRRAGPRAPGRQRAPHPSPTRRGTPSSGRRKRRPSVPRLPPVLLRVPGA